MSKDMLKTWKVKLGTGLVTYDDFRQAFEAAGRRIGNWANNLLGQPIFVVASEATELEIVDVSVAELRLADGATREEIYARAFEQGLECCSAEVGPQLCLQGIELSEGEYRLIAMEPIVDSRGDLGVFGVERDDGELCLRACYGGPDDRWGASARWLFVRRKK